MQGFHAFQLLIFIDVKMHHMCARTGTHTYTIILSISLVGTNKNIHVYNHILYFSFHLSSLSLTLSHAQKHTSDQFTIGKEVDTTPPPDVTDLIGSDLPCLETVHAW